jgi:hypothetical protein
MSKGRPGADSSDLVTSQIGGRSLVDLATETFGEKPAFWGRYFTSAATTGLVEYRQLKEGQLLRDRDIRVLPIARQTKRVAGTSAQGAADAKLNVKDVLLTFRGDYLKSLGGKFLMFLDVESTPPLALSYYKGWASTLSDYSQTLTKGDVTLLPCVYGVQSDNATWRAIASAADQGVTCHGVWIARWKWRGCHPVPAWNAAAVTPSVTLPCDVLVWQYSDECHGGDGYDCNTTNPGINFDAFIKQLILPPETLVS